METDKVKPGPFAQPVPWHVIEETHEGHTAYCVEAKTWWEAMTLARVLNPLLHSERCAFYANVKVKRKR